MIRRLLVVPTLGLALLLTGCSGDPAPTGSASAAPSAASTDPSAVSSPTSASVPRPVKDGCHQLAYKQALAPVVGGTDSSCRKPHTSQTYKIGRLDLVAGGHLVAVDSRSVQARVAATCTSLLGDHVGGTPEALRLSMVQAVWFTPSVEDAAAGADWFRCDVVALAGNGRLAPLPPASKGLVGSSDRFAMCGTAPPDAASFERVPCSAQHTWTAVATVDLAQKSYPSAAAAGDRMESTCRSTARARAFDPLDFTWSEERPSPDQWDAGQRYGICWVPA